MKKPFKKLSGFILMLTIALMGAIPSSAATPEEAPYYPDITVEEAANVEGAEESYVGGMNRMTYDVGYGRIHYNSRTGDAWAVTHYWDWTRPIYISAEINAGSNSGSLNSWNHTYNNVRSISSGVVRVPNNGNRWASSYHQVRGYHTSANNELYQVYRGSVNY